LRSSFLSTLPTLDNGSIDELDAAWDLVAGNPFTAMGLDRLERGALALPENHHRVHGLVGHADRRLRDGRMIASAFSTSAE
jgi:hypothetical protein